MTSEAQILKCCREIVAAEGLSALNMRHVAEKCGVALGSLYHYFPSKDDMITATVESVWQDIFRMDEKFPAGLSFPAYVQRLFECARTGAGAYPNFSMAHSMGFASAAKDRGRRTMERCFSEIRAGMLRALQGDKKVRPDAFSPGFTQEAFVGFVFSAFLSSFVQEQEDCRTLAEIIRRALY